MHIIKLPEADEMKKKNGLVREDAYNQVKYRKW